MLFLRRFKITHRLVALVLIVMLGGFSTIAATLGFFQSALMEEKVQQTRKLVETAFSLVESYAARARGGELSQDQAQQAALDALRALRYDNGNYFWVNDMQPRMIMHPLKPELDGKDLGDFRDPAGTYLFREMVQVVRKSSAGTVHYAWDKPGMAQPAPKISYVKRFPAWDWVIGSGIYVDDVKQSFWRVASIIGGIAVLAVATIVGVLALIGHSIVQPIRITSEAMREVASGDGDLTHRLPCQGNDEITRLNTHFNEFVGRTRDIVESVSRSTVQIATAADQLSAVTRNNAASADAQRVEIDQVATAVNEMNVSAQEVARNSADAADAARQSDQAALSGRSVMARAVASMETLSGEIDSAGGVIDGLKTESENIGSVLSVIRSIAEQTNLLALNAAIEAARAGEQGRGFAVVADEVRTLASRTQASTAEIHQMIERLQTESAKAVSAMQSGRNKTRETLAHAAEADQALVNIVTLVGSITDMNTRIAAAAEQQTGVSQELDRNVVHIAQLAEHAANGSGQTALASSELARLGEDLQRIVRQFKT